MQTTKHSIFWFRRDLRLEDNKGLYHALNNHDNVIPLFIFDTHILSRLTPADARVEFIHSQLEHMQHQLKKMGRSLLVWVGKPVEIFNDILSSYNIQAVYTNLDHEPYGIERDGQIEGLLASRGVSFHGYYDHLLFEKDEVLKPDQTPYTVFTPYARKCREVLTQTHFMQYKVEKLLDHLAHFPSQPLPSLEEIGFTPTGIEFPASSGKEPIIEIYHQTRDYPGQNGTSRLGLHLRFGTISIRQLAAQSFPANSTFFNELLWREFYAMILWHFPHVTTKAFKPRYDYISWRDNTDEFERWKEGKTGYPMVDAGMRELAQTGYMHNRVRMVTASFLTKHLLIDWRWGEAWFAEKLLDYELSSNNGGWQWSAGTGCDAAPYFRIFNPTEQQKKFDPEHIYIKKWIPEWNTDKYPQPMVDHKFARERCLKLYKMALNEPK
jgi:deoxyribodipyrimidine photo-lyase